MRFSLIMLLALLASACSSDDQRLPVEAFGFYPPKAASEDMVYRKTQEIAKSIGFVPTHKMQGITDDSTAIRFKGSKGASLLVTHDPNSQCYQASFQTAFKSPSASQDRFDTLRDAGRMRKSFQQESWAIETDGCSIVP
jgi:hypothetical protein